MSGVTSKTVDVLRKDSHLSGVLTVPGHPGRGVCMWESPGVVQDLSESESEYALSDLWFLLFEGDEDPGE